MSKRDEYALTKVDRRSGLRRVLDTVRSYTLGPLTSSSPELAKYFSNGRETSTGIAVNEWSALNYAAVWAAVNRISGDIASLPLHLLKRDDAGGKNVFASHPLYRLLHDAPNAEMTSVVFRRTVQAHALTWRGGYAEIVRDQANRPIALWPLTPDRVTPFRRSADASLQFRVVNESGGDVIFDAYDILHIPGLGFDGTTGYSVIEKARESIGLGVATEKFGGTFFGNGAQFGGVISYKGPKPTDGSQENLIKALKARYQGVERAHQLLALYNDATYSRMGIPPNDAQFLETRKFQITEIARWFNVPPHKIGDLERATHSNIEQQEIEYYISSLGPWLQVWEQELTAKLIAKSELNLQLIEHNLDGKLRGDSQARGELYSKLFSIGAITPNQIAAKENLPAIEGGDRAFVPLNMVPLDRVDEFIDAQIESKKAPKTPPNPEPAPTDAAINRIAQLEEELRDARRVTQEAEDRGDTRLAAARGEWKESEARLADMHAAEVLRMTGQAESLGRDLVTAAADVQTALTRATDAEALLETVRAELLETSTRAAADAASRDHAFAVVAEDGRTIALKDERIAMIEGDYQRVCGEKIALTTRAETAEGLVTELQRSTEETVTALATMTASRDDLQQQLATRDADLATLRAEVTATAGAIEAERRDAEARATTDDAVRTELRTQIATLVAGSEKLIADVVQATEALARANTLLAAKDGELIEMAEAAAGQRAELATVTTRQAATRQAIRAVAVDLLAFFLEREAGRARRAQANPEKLRAWVQQFYPAQVDVLLSSLRSVATAIGAVDGQTVSREALQDFAHEYLEQSQRALLLLASEHDDETLAPALERVLRRWEAERPEQAADALLRKVA